MFINFQLHTANSYPYINYSQISGGISKNSDRMNSSSTVLHYKQYFHDFILTPTRSPEKQTNVLTKLMVTEKYSIIYGLLVALNWIHEGLPPKKIPTNLERLTCY